MNQKIKVAYIVVGESLDSDLLRRQVIELLADIKAGMQDLEVTLFSFQGILSILNHKKDIAENKIRLRQFGINLVIVPNICPWPIPNFTFRKTDVGWRPNGIWNRFAARFFELAAFPFMLYLKAIKGFDIFHCRSYPAATIAIFLKKIIPNVVVLFDPRSDFPEENVTSGIWKNGSKDFLYWKRKERDLLMAADAVACIGPTYVANYLKNAPIFNSFIAPNNVKCTEFKRKEISREKIRRKLGIDNDVKVYVYLGGMTKDGWHRPSFYRDFYDSILKKNPSEKVKFLFLVPGFSANLVINAFGERGNFSVISPEFDEVADYLSAGDYGMMFLHESKIAVGTKIGEYLAASLPIIVNPNCIGACELIKSNPALGCIVDLGIGDLDSGIFNILKYQSDQMSFADAETLSSFAFGYFDNIKISKTYIQQYKKIIR